MSEKFIDLLVKKAIKMNAGTALSVMRKCGKFADGDLYILYVAKDYDKLLAIKTIVDAICDEDEEQVSIDSSTASKPRGKI